MSQTQSGSPVRSRSRNAVEEFAPQVTGDGSETGPSAPKTPTKDEGVFQPASRDAAAIDAVASISQKLDEQRNSARASAVLTASSPVKGGSATSGLGSSRVTRPLVELALIDELHSHQSNSHNLVDWMFGSVLATESTSNILYELLGMDVVSVYLKGQKTPVPPSGWKAACADAASLARWAATRLSEKIEDKYEWKWEMPVEASGANAAMFMNVVSIAAYAASLRLHEGVTNGDPPLPSLRFVTMPREYSVVPLSDRDQDYRPDVLGFDTDVFHRAPKKATGASGGGAVPNAGAVTDVDDPASKKDAAAHVAEAEPDPDLLWPIEEAACPFRYITKHFSKVLVFTDAQRYARSSVINAFKAWFGEQTERTHLNLSRFCWPEVHLTMAAKLKTMKTALEQEYLYMRQHRRTQPWMRWVWGLAITTDEVCMIRADTLGVECCTFTKGSSRGALDMIRVALGIALSTHTQRGKYENFDLHPTTTSGPRPVKGVPVKRRRTDGKAENSVTYHHRSVRFIHLSGRMIHHPLESSSPDVTYYVHYVMQDTGSLIGRCTRLFCVSREVFRKAGAVEGTRHFEGVYALKLYNADRQSACFRHDLIKEIRDADVPKVLPPTWEWYYGDGLTRRGFSQDAIENYAQEERTCRIPGIVTNREEMFAQSDMKRMLAQCESFDEFLVAFTDFADAISSLSKHGIAHRDLSIGNVLLRRETACPEEFWDEARRDIRRIAGSDASFSQRPLDKIAGGVLHDLDMAGRLTVTADDFVVPPPVEQQKRTPFVFGGLDNPPSTEPAVKAVDKGLRTGTLPFMAVHLIKYGPPHRVEHDMHSLLFVMILFYWSYPAFVDIKYPRLLPARVRPWPVKVLAWANPPSLSDLQLIGGAKSTFFENQDAFQAIINETMKHDHWLKDDPRYVKLLWSLYLTLWSESTSVHFKSRTERLSFPPELIGDVLRSLRGVSVDSSLW